jgi:hypothetical protein
MHKKYLAVLAVVAFVLTLLFAVAAGAQEESTDSSAPASDEGATGEQSVEVQQQQVQNDQVQVATLAVETQAQGCRDPQTEEVIQNRAHDEGTFEVEGGAIEIRYDLTVTGNNNNELFIEVRDEDDDVVRRLRLDRTTTDEQTVRTRVNPGTFSFDVDADDNVTDYRVELVDCRNTEPLNNDGNGGINNGGSGGGTTDGMVTVAQESTTPDTTTTGETTTADTNTVNPVTETTTADNANRDGSFRCEFFLRSVRDDRGALKTQYRGDEVVVQRFEQCLSGDVLANTIPKRNLPFTGGMPLLGLAALGLASLVAGASVLGVVMRRGR